MLKGDCSLEPRPYQVAGVDRLANALTEYGRGADFSDAGTGKTFKTAFILRKLGRKALVICPRAVVTAWELVLDEAGIEGTVTTYGLARNEKVPYGRWAVKTKRIQKYVWEGVPKDVVLVFDEVQQCKGEKTLNSKLLTAARQSGVPTLVLSATPATDPTEMKALGYVLGLYPSVKDWWFWAMRHGCKPGPMGGLVYDHSSGGMEKIGKQLVPILDKVRTMDVPEFPAVDNQVLIIDLPKGETLDEEYRALLQTLQDEAEEESVEALRIRQMIEHKKLSTLKEMALEYMSEGNSVVIFLQYSRSIDILEEQLGDLFTVYHGRLNFADREANKNNFQSNQKRGILVQIRAGGMGIGFHDIHGGHPRISLLCATGSADLFYQASGRTPRDGAKSKSIVKMVIAAKTPEMGLRKTLEAKCNSLHELTDADLIPSI